MANYTEPDASARLLATDGDWLSIAKSGLEGFFMLTLSDGSNGFFISVAEWPKIRAKIDAFIEARANEED